MKLPYGVKNKLVARGSVWFTLPAGSIIRTENMDYKILSDITFQMTNDTPIERVDSTTSS